MVQRNAASVIIFDETRRVLLQKRGADAPRLPSSWSLFGGGIEGNEAPEEAVTRELWEELQYKPKNLLFEFEHTYTLPEVQEGGRIFIFSELFDSTQNIILGEGEAYAWFYVDELPGIPLAEITKRALEYFHYKVVR